MDTSLLDTVKHSLLNGVSSFDFSILEHEESASFGNAQVMLQSDELRLRVIRDRGLVFVDFGSAAAPRTWFDSAVVFDWLKLSALGGLHGSDSSHVLRGVAELLRACGPEIREKFSRSHFQTANTELETIRDSRAAKLYRFVEGP